MSDEEEHQLDWEMQSDFETLDLCLDHDDACHLNAAVYQMISEGHQMLSEASASRQSRSERRTSLSSGSERCRQSDFSQCGWRRDDSEGEEMGAFGSDAPIDLLWLLQRCDSDVSLLTMVMEAFEEQGKAHCSSMADTIQDGQFEALFASAVSYDIAVSISFA
jgi:hypothetical protein